MADVEASAPKVAGEQEESSVDALKAATASAAAAAAENESKKAEEEKNGGEKAAAAPVDEEGKKDGEEEGKAAAAPAVSEAKKEEVAAAPKESSKPEKVASDADIEAIKNQMKFYFSDNNLGRDLFLLDKIKEDSQGFVPVELFLLFNRINERTSRTEDIAKAIEQVDELELDETKTKVKRVTPFDAEAQQARIKEAPKRSLFVSGFDPRSKIDDCREPFEKAVGADKVVYVKMRRDEGAFIGSCFVELMDRATALAVLEKKDELKNSAGKAFTKVEVLEDWLEAERAARAERKGKRSREDAGDEDKAKDGNDGNNKNKRKPFEWKPKCVILLKGLGDKFDFDEIKKLCVLEDGTELRPWIDNRNLEGEGDVGLQFRDPEYCAKALIKCQAADEKVFGGTKPSEIRLLEGEEETKYWAKVQERFQSRNDKKGNNSRNGRGKRRRF